MQKIIVIEGPTASGKTDLGIQLARQFKGEVISADSRQIYKHLDIGTAKPVPDDAGTGFSVQGIPHHLMDCVEPDEPYSMQLFKDQVVAAAQDIAERGNVPFLVGGTALYIKAIVDNFDVPRVEPNVVLRAKFEQEDAATLYKRLQLLDSDAAALTGPDNKRRIIRALEVIVQTGLPFSQQRQKGEPLFTVLEIGIAVAPEVLRERIDRRVDEQIERGLVAEVEGLLAAGYRPNLPALSAVGYKEIIAYLQGTITQERAIALIKRNVRYYARKQMQWFSRNPRVNWVQNATEAAALVRQFLK